MILDLAITLQSCEEIVGCARPPCKGVDFAKMTQDGRSALSLPTFLAVQKPGPEVPRLFLANPRNSAQATIHRVSGDRDRPGEHCRPRRVDPDDCISGQQAIRIKHGPACRPSFHATGGLGRVSATASGSVTSAGGFKPDVIPAIKNSTMLAMFTIDMS